MRCCVRRPDDTRSSAGPWVLSRVTSRARCRCYCTGGGMAHPVYVVAPGMGRLQHRVRWGVAQARWLAGRGRGRESDTSRVRWPRGCCILSGPLFFCASFLGIALLSPFGTTRTRLNLPHSCLALQAPSQASGGNGQGAVAMPTGVKDIVVKVVCASMSPGVLSIPCSNPQCMRASNVSEPWGGV
jgi:hypothetical protein